jgi:RHS repeat-associated protein
VIGTTTNNFWYVGQLGYYHDLIGPLETYYVRARHYIPTDGMWISKDPRQDNLALQMLYVYVENSPQMYVDPSGADLSCLSASEQAWCIGNTTAFSAYATACCLSVITACCAAVAALSYVMNYCMCRPLNSKELTTRGIVDKLSNLCSEVGIYLAPLYGALTSLKFLYHWL